jgi:hypothetical protein
MSPRLGSSCCTSSLEVTIAHRYIDQPPSPTVLADSTDRRSATTIDKPTRLRSTKASTNNSSNHDTAPPSQPSRLVTPQICSYLCDPDLLYQNPATIPHLYCNHEDLRWSLISPCALRGDLYLTFIFIFIFLLASIV